MHARPQTKTRPPSVARRARFRPRGSPEGQRGLEPSRVAADLHLGDPLDPAVTAVARGHEPQGEAVLGGECFIFNVGGQQEIPGFLQRKPATIAGGGAKHEAARTLLHLYLFHQHVHQHPAPALDRVPAAGAIERGLADGAAEGEDVFVREGPLAFDLAVDPEPPEPGVYLRYRVAQPVGGGVEVAREARLLARAREAASGGPEEQ